MDNTQRIILDIQDNQTYEQIYAKQYNEGYPIEFEITKNGFPIDLSGIVAIFELKKPDNTIIVEDCIIENNIVFVNITNQMTIIDGKAKFQVVLFDADSYVPENRSSAIVIATVTGTMKIDKSVVLNEDIESSKDVFNIITEVLIKIEEAKDASQKAQEYMNKSLEYSNSSKDSAIASANSASASKNSEDNAKVSENNAKLSEENSADSALLSKSWAIGETGISTRLDEDTNNSKYFAEQSSVSASASKNSEDNAKVSENASKLSEQNSKQSEENAATSAITAEKYAIGNIDSAKYYYEQAKTISESFSGALRPMGTVTFENLPSISSATEGDMYNVSNEFTTTSDFKEGEGKIIPSGSNVYKTSDEKWDILVGTPVVGVKGANESTYRRGNINITANDVGFEIISITEPSNQEIGCYWLVDY